MNQNLHVRVQKAFASPAGWLIVSPPVPFAPTSDAPLQPPSPVIIRPAPWCFSPAPHRLPSRRVCVLRVFPASFAAAGLHSLCRRSFLPSCDFFLASLSIGPFPASARWLPFLFFFAVVVVVGGGGGFQTPCLCRADWSHAPGLQPVSKRLRVWNFHRCSNCSFKAELAFWSDSVTFTDWRDPSNSRYFLPPLDW